MPDPPPVMSIVLPLIRMNSVPLPNEDFTRQVIRNNTSTAPLSKRSTCPVQ